MLVQPTSLCWENVGKNVIVVSFAGGSEWNFWMQCILWKVETV